LLSRDGAPPRGRSSYWIGRALTMRGLSLGWPLTAKPDRSSRTPRAQDPRFPVGALLASRRRRSTRLRSAGSVRVNGTCSWLRRQTDAKPESQPRLTPVLCCRRLSIVRRDEFSRPKECSKIEFSMPLAEHSKNS
jgi:hypothetical protein